MQAKAANSSLLAYNYRFYSALALISIALALFAMQCMYQWQLATVRLPRGGPLWLFIAVGCSLGFSYWGYKSGFILRRACGIDSGVYLGFLIATKLSMITLILAGGLGLGSPLEELSKLRQEVGSQLSRSGTVVDSNEQTTQFSLGNVKKYIEDTVVGAFQAVWGLIKQLWLAVFGVVWRLLLAFIMISMVIAFIPALIIAQLLRIRSAFAVLWWGLLLFVSIWALQASAAHTWYTTFACLALWGSVGLVTNWSSMQLNRAVWEYNPVYYDMVTSLANSKLKRISAREVEETIRQHIGWVPAEYKEPLVEEIESRLVEDRLLVRLSDGAYRPAYRKRLGILHLVLLCLALVYLLNGGFGMFELVPDNLPFIGNLDEAAIAGLLAAWLFNLYKLDRAEEEGQPLAEEGTFVPIGQPSSLGGAKVVLSPRDERRSIETDPPRDSGKREIE